jgi:predicted dehydrogenase
MQTVKNKPPVRLGIIGAGFMGQVGHLMNYVEVNNCKIVALAEMRPELCAQVAHRYNIPETYNSHLDLLKNADVDAVAIITMREMIGPIALDCLNAGKAVITEKPMASTYQQALKLVEAAERNNVIYKVGYMRLFDEGVQKAKTIIDDLRSSNELGQVIFARVHCFGGSGYCNIDGHIMTDEPRPLEGNTWPSAPDWCPKELAVHYNEYLNTYCHDINLIRHLLGATPKLDTVNFKNRSGRVATLDFGSFIASIETGFYSYLGWDSKIEIFFEHGSITIKTPPQMLRNVSAEIEIYKAGDLQVRSQPLSGWTWSFRRQAQAFIDDVQNGVAHLGTAKDALEDMRLIEEMWKKAAQS